MIQAVEKQKNMTNPERNPRICKNCSHGQMWMMKNLSLSGSETSTKVEIFLKSLHSTPAQIKAQMCAGSEEMKCLRVEEKQERG